MNGHLVTVEVSVERCTDERVQLDRFTFDEVRFERLDTKAVKCRSAVQENRVLADNFFEDGVAISTGVFAGFGTATIARLYGDLFDLPTAPAASAPAGRGPNGRIRFGTSPSADTPVRIHDDFTMAEPQLNIVWSITPWLRLDAGAGYRFIGNADLTEQQVRGPSGSLALQFGGK